MDKDVVAHCASVETGLKQTIAFCIANAVVAKRLFCGRAQQIKDITETAFNNACFPVETRTITYF